MQELSPPPKPKSSRAPRRHRPAQHRPGDRLDAKAEAKAEAQAFLTLAHEPGGMVDKVARLAARLRRQGYVTEDPRASEGPAGDAVYRVEPLRKKRRPTWNDARDASQRLPVFVARHGRRQSGWGRDTGNKAYHEISPTSDHVFVGPATLSAGVLPTWVAARGANTGVTADLATGGVLAADAARAAGGVNLLGGLIDAADQGHAWLDMKSAAKKAAIDIVTSFHALLKVMRHLAGEDGAAVPADEDWVAASHCMQALARHPKFSAEIADATRRCQVATWRDVGVGVPAGLVGLTRLGVGAAAAADGASEVLSVGAGALGDVSSGVLSPVSSFFDIGHSKMEHRFWGAKRREAKAAMAWLKDSGHIPVPADLPSGPRGDRELFNAMLPACWQAHHDVAKHAKFMKRCSYVRFLKGAANGAVAWPLWIALMATGIGTLGAAAIAIGGGLGTFYLTSMGAKLGRNVRRKRELKSDQQAADIVMATRRGEGLLQAVRAGRVEVTAPQGSFVGGNKVFGGQATHRIDVQLSPAMGLACFATLVDKLVCGKPLDAEVRARLLKFLARRGVGELELCMLKEGVLAAARLRKAADPSLDDVGDEWDRLQDLQNRLGPCFGLPRGATKLSDGVFLESFFGARLAQRAQTHVEEHPECGLRVDACVARAGALLSEPAQGLALLNRVASDLAEAAPGIHYRHCSDAEMQGIADRLFPGIPPRLFLEKCEHLLAMAAQARRKGDHFEWKVDGLPMHDLARFCRFVRERWKRDVPPAPVPSAQPRH